MLVLNALYFRIDIIILSILRSEQEVGWYSLAYKIIENGLFFPAMLGGLLLPHISAAITSQNFYKAKELVSQGLTLSVYGGSIIVAVLVIFPKQLIFFIAGHNFLESAPLLQILSIALAIMFVGNIFGFALIALSEQRKLVWLYLALLIGNLVCNAIFIPLYGAIAAAWVTVATELVAMVVAARIVYMRLRWSMPVFQIGLGLAAAFVASYVGHILPSGVHIAARVCFVAVLYGGMGYVFGLWDKRTIGILRSVSSI
jgi:O-antigen/teichoic acid export membrane protein